MVKSEENSVDRRDFLKIAAGSAAALVASAPRVGAQESSARPSHEQSSEGAKKVDAPATERTTGTSAEIHIPKGWPLSYRVFVTNKFPKRLLIELSC